MADRVCTLVVSWDWEGPVITTAGREVVARGVPVPLEPAIVEAIPFGLMSALYQGIVRAEVGDPKPRRKRS